jgi:hypothetical protein
VRDVLHGDSDRESKQEQQNHLLKADPVGVVVQIRFGRAADRAAGLCDRAGALGADQVLAAHVGPSWDVPTAQFDKLDVPAQFPP